MVYAQPGKKRLSYLTLPELIQLLDQAANEKRKPEVLLAEKLAEIQRLEDFIKAKIEPELLQLKLALSKAH